MNQILIADGTVGNVSALTLQFDRDEADGPSGYMIENSRLRRALYDKIQKSAKALNLKPDSSAGFDTNARLDSGRREGHVELFAPIGVKAVARGEASVFVTLEDGTDLDAAILIAADGRNSKTRREAAIGLESKAYKQHALVATLDHTGSHRSTAYEIFYPTGPFALLPLAGNKSSLVWSDFPATLKAAQALAPDALAEEIERRTNGLIGTVTQVTNIAVYPLALQLAETYTDTRLALIGDAAHVMHPIAGQGMNMGLRDAAALADVLAEAKSRGLDLGGTALSDYALWRNFDNRAMAAGTDMINRMFSNDFKPLAHARRLGMRLIQGIAPLRATITREAAGELGRLPSLMISK